MQLTSISLTLLLLSTTPFAQDDWPQFQGPNVTAKVEAVASSFDWGETGPEVLWRTDVGPGFGGPSVRDGKVYLLDREVGVLDYLRVIDLASGEDEWDVSYEAPGRLQYQGSRTVPAVTDTHVVCVGGLGQVTAVSLEEQDIAWTAHLEEDYGGLMPMFGWSCSPVIVDDLVIVTALGEDVGLVAFDLATGEERWVTETVGHSHSTPALLTLKGKEQLVFLSTMYPTSGRDQAAPTTISSFDPQDGTLLWRDETLLTRLPIPPPIQVDDEHFFVTGGYRGGSTLLSVGDGGVEEVWHVERGAQVHAPILFEDHFYVIVNENWNHPRNRKEEGGLACYSKDGKEVWRTKADPFFGRGNMFLAGDKLVIQDGENGILRIVPATPEGFSIVAESNVFEITDRRDHEMWAPMALSGGRLLLRSQEELICVKL